MAMHECRAEVKICNPSDGITSTVIPSNRVTVNQTVTLQCILDPNPTPPVYVSFDIQSPHSTVCSMEPSFGVCTNTPNPCIDMYNASCPGIGMKSLWPVELATIRATLSSSLWWVKWCLDFSIQCRIRLIFRNYVLFIQKHKFNYYLTF